MRTMRWISIVVLSLLFVLGPAGIAEAQSYQPEELQFLQLINQYRQENGLQPLLLSDPLSTASERHSEDMGTYGFFSHTTEGSSYYPIGSSPWDRMAAEGYGYDTYKAENLAYGQTTAEAVFEAWRNSPEHNVNMLGDYKVIGIGLAWVNGTPYWTTDFGAYVDPSASPGGTPEKQPAPKPASKNSVKQPAADKTTSPAPEVTSETVASPKQKTTSTHSAADSQTDPKASRLKRAASRLAETAPSTKQAAADQYADADTLKQASGQEGTTTQATAAANASTGQSTASTNNAGAEATTAADDAAIETTTAGDKTGTQATAEAEAQPTVTEQSSDSQEAGSTQTATQASSSASQEISVLPDTGGIPLPLLGGVALLSVGLLTGRRVFR